MGVAPALVVSERMSEVARRRRGPLTLNTLNRRGTDGCCVRADTTYTTTRGRTQASHHQQNTTTHKHKWMEGKQGRKAIHLIVCFLV